MSRSDLLKDRRLLTFGTTFVVVVLFLLLSRSHFAPTESSVGDASGVAPLAKSPATNGPTTNRLQGAQIYHCHGKSGDDEGGKKSHTHKAAHKNKSGGERLAYVAWLSATVIDEKDEDLENDKYFVAMRILIWQLLHVPDTRTRGIDVVVMVTPGVSESRRARLRKDGAIVHPIDFLSSETHWEKADSPRWNAIMSKLRVFELTQYSRVLMLDGDTILFRRLDGIFDDPAAQITTTLQEPESDAPPLAPNNPTKPPSIEAKMPDRYLLASISEVANSDHGFPPTSTTGIMTPSYFNAGFFMVSPSRSMFDYCVALLNTPDSFESAYMEQNLLNTVHNWHGLMPWRELNYTWNVRWPNENDVARGLVSAHEKWWEHGSLWGNEELKAKLLSKRWEMKGWYAAYDAMRGGQRPGGEHNSWSGNGLRDEGEDGEWDEGEYTCEQEDYVT